MNNSKYYPTYGNLQKIWVEIQKLRGAIVKDRDPDNAIVGSSLVISNFSTPDSSADPSGSEGSIVWDEDYLYVKTVSGWKRTALTTF